MRLTFVTILLLANATLFAQWQGTNPVYFNAGNVGIGTTSPNSTLAVKGRFGIRADADPSTPGETMRVEGGFTSEENVMNVTNMADQDFVVRLSGVGASVKRTIIGPSVNTRFSLGVGVSAGNEYLTLVNGGNVGIGTIMPNAKLDLGNGYGSNGVKLLIYNDNSSSELAGTKCGFYMDNFRPNNLNLVFPEASANPGLFTISAKNTSGTTLNPYFSVAGLTGNVGIGTTSPTARLQIEGYGQYWTTSYWGTSIQLPNASVLRWAANQEGWRFGLGQTSGGLYFVRSNSDNNSTVPTNDLFISNAGYVGIGTTSPNQKLTVNGTIYGKEVKVDLGVPGPDYVFEKDYKLTSLEEIKDYIDQNKHLPEVPSAKEMGKNGINVGEMNMLLLKKIEELTLYVIGQNKMMNDLRKENDHVMGQMEIMQSEIDRLKK